MLQRSPGVLTGLLAVLAVAGCGESPYRTSNLQEIKAVGMSVFITHARSEAEARPLADDYCRTQGRTARFKGVMQYRTKREISKGASFECHQEATSPAQAEAGYNSG